MNNDLGTIFGQGFDGQGVEPAADFDALPPGKYPVMIEKAEVKTTKSGTGNYIKLQLRVLDGPGKNRVLFDNINVKNDNAQCVEIGLRSLAALRIAINLPVLSDTAQLFNQCCLAHIKVDKENQNAVRTYSAYPDVKLVQRPQQNATYPTGPANYQTKENNSVNQVSPTEKKLPWERK